MFGYVTAYEPELKMKDFRKYKAYYCGLCKVLREQYGHLGQITLTYDMTFAVIFLTSLYEQEPKAQKHRCKVHPMKKQWMLTNDITRYAADMNLILAFFHLKDDWDDERKVSGFIGKNLLKRRVRKVIEKYPDQVKVIRKELKKLGEYEKANTQQIDFPAGCFGRLMEELFIYRKDCWEPDLRKMGFFLGKFIYIMDAYDDLDKDIEKGNYNPLKELSKQEDYEEQIHHILCMMMGECTAAFEKMPCILDIDILRNILYDGVWTRYRKIQEKKREEKDNYVKKSL